MPKIKPNITFDGTMTEPLTLEKEDTLQLGKGGCRAEARAAAKTVARAGGCRPRTPRPFFCLFDIFWSKLALFLSTPRKLSLPPLDRARRSDSDAPIESSVAQF